MKIKIIQIRECPKCVNHLIKHPTLWTKRVTEQTLTKKGWIHNTNNGKMLHTQAIK